MSAIAALVVLVLATRASAIDARLLGAPDPDVGSFSGQALSFGFGRPACARITFDPKTAVPGGRIFVTPGIRAADEEGIRLSEAVITGQASLLSRTAIVARRYRIAAVSLGRSRWDAQGRLVLREPIFGRALRNVLPVVGERDRVLTEGEVACVNPAVDAVFFPAAKEADAIVDAAQAARAYDGLRDVGALERWLEADPRRERAAALMDEMASRVLDGEISMENLTRLQRATKSAGSGRAWKRALSVASAQSGDCAASAADAPSVEVLDRLVAEASVLAARAQDAGKIYGGGDGDLAAAARACRNAAAKRRLMVPRLSPSLEAAAVAAGATRSKSVSISSEVWKSFAVENDLNEFLSRSVDDASLGLRRKSERIRERILSTSLSPDSAAGRAVLATTSNCPCQIIGEDVTLKAADSRGALSTVREVWAESWGPGPLGARLRAGRGLDFSGALRIVVDKNVDASGVAFSRDPGSGRRRLEIEVDENGDPKLTPAQRSRVARMARALDAWRGGGVEVAFAFSGSELYVYHARPLEPPRPLQPLTDPFSPRLSPEALNVKSVR